jgi:hypothetical protein
MDANTYVGGEIDEETGCTDSSFEEVDPAKLPTLSTSDSATQAWYSGKQYYDFKKGTYQKKLGELMNKHKKNNPALTAAEKKRMTTQ